MAPLHMAGERRLLGALPLGVFFVVVLAGVGARLGDAMPQVVKGDGALAVAFGDARETLGRSFVQKADSYFHGGVDMACGHEGAPGRDGHDEHDACDGHDGHGEHGGHERHGVADPWAWINSHVRAPVVHRHLEGGEAVEMMPWLWASVKADPHNIDAWSAAWYAANNIVKDKALALRVVAEGLKANPGDPELLVCRGRTLYDHGRGDLAAAREAFTAAIRSAEGLLLRGGAADERISRARDFAKVYLEDGEKKGGGL